MRGVVMGGIMKGEKESFRAVGRAGGVKAEITRGEAGAGEMVEVKVANGEGEDG